MPGETRGGTGDTQRNDGMMRERRGKVGGISRKKYGLSIGTKKLRGGLRSTGSSEEIPRNGEKITENWGCGYITRKMATESRK